MKPLPDLPWLIWKEILLCSSGDIRQLAKLEAVSRGFKDVIRKQCWPGIRKLRISCSVNKRDAILSFSINRANFPADFAAEKLRKIIERLTSLTTITLDTDFVAREDADGYEEDLQKMWRKLTKALIQGQ